MKVSSIGALILAAAPVRHFFELDLLNAGQWFLCLASVAAGLVVASALWRLPYIQSLEVDPNAPPPEEPEIDGTPIPAPTHRSLLHRRRRSE